MFDVMDVAQYVINYCDREGHTITNLQLQKILYFVQLEFYNVFKKLLFMDEFEAWYLGPTIVKVFKYYAAEGNQNPLKSKKIKQIAFNEKTMKIEENVVYPVLHFSTPSEQEIVENTIQKYWSTEWGELIQISKHTQPWQINYKENKTEKIPLSDMKKYCRNHC